MNKYYANKERNVPFNYVYKMGYDESSIEDMDCLEDLFKEILLELDGRRVGAELLIDEEIGSKIEVSSNVGKDFLDNDDDIDIVFEDLENKRELIYDYKCHQIAVKRAEALRTLHEGIEILYKMFYNSNVKDLEKLVKHHQGGI